MGKLEAVPVEGFIHTLPTLRSEAASTRLSADWIMTTVVKIFKSAARSWMFCMVLSGRLSDPEKAEPWACDACTLVKQGGICVVKKIGSRQP